MVTQILESVKVGISTIAEHYKLYWENGLPDELPKVTDSSGLGFNVVDKDRNVALNIQWSDLPAFLNDTYLPSEGVTPGNRLMKIEVKSISWTIENNVAMATIEASWVAPNTHGIAMIKVTERGVWGEWTTVEPNVEPKK